MDLAGGADTDRGGEAIHHDRITAAGELSPFSLMGASMQTCEEEAQIFTHISVHAYVYHTLICKRNGFTKASICHT